MVIVMLLSAGCSTQHFTSVLPAGAVAPCIATKWESCGASRLKVPVALEKQANGYLVGIAMSGWFGLPSGATHADYTVWAEVMDANPGSATEYHQAFQIVHGCLDRVVVECQGKPQ